MSFFSSHYRDGQEIRLGDLFENGRGRLGYVVAVVGTQHITPGWEPWLESCPGASNEGFLFVASYGPCFFEESDEDQKLILRADSGIDLEASAAQREGGTIKERIMILLREMESAR